MSLGQSNATGTIKDLENRMLDLNNRLNDIETDNKKWYIKLVPFPVNGNRSTQNARYGYFLTHDGAIEIDDSKENGTSPYDYLRPSIKFDVKINGETVFSKTENSSNVFSQSPSSESIIQVNNSLPVIINFSGRNLYRQGESSTKKNYTINFYKFGELAYTVSNSSDKTYSFSLEFTVDRNIKLFRSTGSGTTINVYIEEYTIE